MRRWSWLRDPAKRVLRSDSAKEAGEIASDLDPAVVLVVLFSAALAPVTLGGLIEGVVDGGVDGYADRQVDVVKRLAP